MVVFKDWEEPNVRVMKRVIHLPKELVEGTNRLLGPNEYWVEGDNKEASKDSRFFGPIKRGDILGVVVN